MDMLTLAVALGYTKKQVEEAKREGFRVQVEQDRSILETVGEEKVFYFLPKTVSKPKDGYDEFIYANNDWEQTGTTDIDLSAYALKSEIPTKVSQLQNDSGYLTEHQDISGKADKATTLVGYGITDGQQKIDSNNKLSSDLVDDSNQTNKFVTTNEKTTWSAKYDKPNSGIPKTDLSEEVQTSLSKADTALQTHQDISGKADKSTTLSGYGITDAQTKIDNNNKLSSDLVDDTNQTNKFVTGNDKTSWSAKYDKPNDGIPSTDLSAAVQTSLGKADTALQYYTEQYTGTVTGVTMNGNSLSPTDGVVDLGTIITMHQDISGKADKSTTLAGYGINNAYTKSEVNALVGGETIPTYITTEVDRLATVVNARRSPNTLTMLFISDMHADPEHKQLNAEQSSILSTALKHAGQAVGALAELVPFNLMAVLGDYVYGTQQSISSGLKSFAEVNGYLEKGFSKAQNVRIAGNHDDLRYNHTTDYLNDGQLYSLIGKYSTMPVYGSREKNYGYIDFDSCKVRVIFVNANDGTTNSPENGNVSEEQLQWFADTLGEVGQKASWHILILSHQPIDFRNVSPIGNITADYIDGASNAYYDFTNKNNAKLIANIHGHTHNCLVDNLYKISNSSAVATTAHRMAIPNACFYLNGNGNEYTPSSNYGINYSDNDYATSAYQTKIQGNENDTAFTVVTIDLANEMVYADQYGFGHYKNCDRSFSFGNTPTPTPSITNQLSISQYPLGTVSGVMNGKRWNSSGALRDKESDTQYSKATGYIPVTTGDVIRMSGVKFGANTVQKNATCYIHSYGSGLTPENSGTYTSANNIAAYQLSNQPSSLSFANNIQYDSDGNVVQFTVTSGNYITICTNSTSEDGGIPDNAVLTINEEIN